MTTVFLFPFAGGDRHSYQFLKPYFSSSIKTVTIEPPGRGGRFGQPLLQDMDLVVDDALTQISDHIGGDYLFFGHSMGALTAFLLAKRLQALRANLPKLLVVSGRNPPSIDDYQASGKQLIHEMETDDFFSALDRYDHVNEALRVCPDLRQLYEPILKADFKALASHTPTEPHNLLSIPIHCLIGQEEAITLDNARLWQEETTSGCTITTLSGHHFFIYNHAAYISHIINTSLLIRHET